MYHCPKCGGRLRAETVGWKCEKCRVFIDMHGRFHEHKEIPFAPPMTYGDLIRSMSNEEMAEFFTMILSNQQIQIIEQLLMNGIAINDCAFDIPMLTKTEHLEWLDEVIACMKGADNVN